MQWTLVENQITKIQGKRKWRFVTVEVVKSQGEGPKPGIGNNGGRQKEIGVFKNFAEVRHMVLPGKDLAKWLKGIGFDPQIGVP